LADKQDTSPKGEQVKFFDYVAFLSRNKWRFAAGLSLAVGIFLVVGLMQSLREKKEARAFEAYEKADSAKEHRNVGEGFPGTFYGSASLIKAGNLLFEGEKFGEARKLYVNYLRSYPDSPFRAWVYNLVGATFEAEKNYDEAISYYSRAQDSSSVELQAKLNRGRCWELKGDLESQENLQVALDCYDAARTLYRELTEAGSATAGSPRPAITPWQRQAQSRMKFLRDKETQTRRRQQEKKVDKDNE
jgi:tetratricopeptide (TPR) repeat protein